MKKLRVLPIVISLIISMTIVTVAWIVQDAQVSGLRVTSSSDGVTLKVKLSSDVYATPSETLDLAGDLTLKPCKYVNGAFYNKDNEVVSSNLQYVRSYTIQVVPDGNCTLKATKSISGDLPVNIICNGVEITSDTDLGAITGITALTLYVYVDGENFSGQATSDITITLHGED